MTIFALSICYLRFVYNVLSEKEARITENLRNMGMNMFSHYMSWILWANFTLFLSSIPWMIITSLGLFPNISFIIVWTLFLLPGMALLAMGFFICAFFSKAKPGVLAALIMFFILYGASIAMGSIANLSTTSNFFFALSPFAGLDKSAKMLLLV